ncbi:MAG TPA: BNR-4 repeat-containing protein [Opitutaceae bacterium]
MNRVLSFFLPVALLAAVHCAATELRPAGDARLLPIAGDGWSGSSINVVAGLQNTLITHGATQFAAFYAADSTIVLARREIGSDVWTTRRTDIIGRTANAHNTVAIAVDGDGFLHIAWDHHGDPLNYARSTAPLSLELGPREPMTGSLESEVTYPAFLELPGGDLLFLYRDGRSGRGNLVLNRYSVRARTWTQIQPNLIDGEGARSAYTNAVVDRRGVFHLAWNWRSSPDVATNHDIAYARSADGGVTWTSIAGTPLPVPITAANADYALRVGPNRSMMNPPSLAVDGQGRPYIASFWTPEGSDIPQFHLVFRDADQWRVAQVSRRTTPFVLAGTATKRPPLSRAVVAVREPWRKPREVYLVYRDDERSGRIVAAECRDFARPDEWNFRDLTASSVGAWEPSLDPAQWTRMSQVHMLVQQVVQRDGNDTEAAATEPTVVSSMIWSPFVAGFTASPDPAPVPPAGARSAPISPASVLELMERATDYHLAQPMRYHPAGWENAPFNIGALALARISASPRFHDAILARAEANEWKPAPRVHHADDYCVLQAYAELHRIHGDARMITPAIERLEAILADPPPVTLDWEMPNALDRWSWCDALFMAPASWLMLWKVTGDPRYLDHMNREWHATTDALWVPGERLYARDQSFLDLRERNGRGIFWSRGNGWVAAGLARVLDLFPEDHPDRARYVAQYHAMMDAVLAAQQLDGLWRPGLLDPATHTASETSGSSFYTFALTWGINRGLLDRARFEPAVRRAWLALAECVNSEGRLEHVQPIGAAPEGFDPHHTEPFGVGAFLLAGSEIYRLVGGTPNSSTTVSP